MLPEASVAVQFTVVVPMANVDPDAGVQVTAGLGLAGSSSVAVAVKVTAPRRCPHGVDGDRRRQGQHRRQDVRTVTVNDPVPVLPAASVAVQFTVVVPMAKVEPDAGVQRDRRVRGRLVGGGGRVVDDRAPGRPGGVDRDRCRQVDASAGCRP